MKVKHFFYSALVLFSISAILTSTSFVLSQTTSSSTSSGTVTTAGVVSQDTKDEIDALNIEIKKRQEKIKELEGTMNTYRQAINEKQTQVSSLKNQLGMLDNRMAALQIDIDLTNEKIKQTQLEIDALNLTISDKEKTIARQKNIIAKMVENIHAGDQKNYIEIMLTYNNFSEFYNELRSTESVYVDLGQSVKMIRLAKEELDVRVQQVGVKKQTYIDLQNQLETTKGNLSQQQFAKQQILVDTRSSEARYQTLLKNLKQQYTQVQNEQTSAEDKLKQKLRSENKLTVNGDIQMFWPVPSRVINAYFHDSDYPFRKVFEHSGIDLRAPFGTPIRATADGYIAKARRCTLSSCYAYVLIVHSTTISTVYGHMSKILVNADQFVNHGDIIGYSGGTPGTVGAGPFVTGPHLHFEVRLNGIPVNPMSYMAP
jgi:murein DD-endopeptidase MepM/ murein hydrolase activator NlpD